MEDISAFKQNCKLELSGSQALQSYKNETQITEAKPLKWSHLVAERSIKFGRNIFISIRIKSYFVSDADKSLYREHCTYCFHRGYNVFPPRGGGAQNIGWQSYPIEVISFQ